MTTSQSVALASLSAAMDGGFVAIADVSGAMSDAGAADDYRLIGGVAVLLHVRRLTLDLPLRATGDADFGVPPYLLKEPGLVRAIEARGYQKITGNRWQRSIDDRRVAVVDLLIPAYTSRARQTKRVGHVVTTEVPGLAVALRRPGIAVDAELRLTNDEVRETTIVLPMPSRHLCSKREPGPSAMKNATLRIFGAASRSPRPMASLPQSWTPKMSAIYEISFSASSGLAVHRSVQ